ncbi:MAG: tRNA (adenosine(37)-N6)-threonylcarbamoyltransferase complex dimerization subunit type 1 TsaB [Symbiobacteriaceae bacterium]|nr:tRNA (adenosine(37)-N6)-threonylcarbamoyltransferase complex dimerization subunit type 1 TsaB [Symbiobacteriaceae bacterium]
MLFLAFDTATRYCGVAILDDYSVRAEYLLQSSLTHSQRLLPAIDLLLRDCKCKPKDLEMIVVSQGPGSFTGLRIGLGHAKGFAQALSVPLIGVSSLLHWAASLGPYLSEGSVIVPLLNAGRNEYYSCFYTWSSGKAIPLLSEAPRSAEELKLLVAEYSTKRNGVYTTGDLPVEQRLLLQSTWDYPMTHLGEAYTLPRPVTLGLLGLERYQRGDRDDLYSLVPTYLRQSEAERLYRARIDSGTT